MMQLARFDVHVGDGAGHDDRMAAVAEQPSARREHGRRFHDTGPLLDPRYLCAASQASSSRTRKASATSAASAGRAARTIARPPATSRRVSTRARPR